MERQCFDEGKEALIGAIRATHALMSTPQHVKIAKLTRDMKYHLPNKQRTKACALTPVAT
jgi:hypothetical protein